MIPFNINDYICIQITEEGWKHLESTVGLNYIKHCIKAPSYEVIIQGETWYRLQCHSVFDLFYPISINRLRFKSNILIDTEND